MTKNISQNDSSLSSMLKTKDKVKRKKTKKAVSEIMLTKLVKKYPIQTS